MKRSENQAEWEKRVLERGVSGQSKVGFCRDRGVSVSALDYWERKLRAGSNATDRRLRTMRFARVKVEPLAEPVGLSIRFSCGVVVESSCGYPDPSWLTSIARALEEVAR